MERQYIMYEEAVQRLSAFATECGLHMVILKGYGLSLNQGQSGNVENFPTN